MRYPSLIIVVLLVLILHVGPLSTAQAQPQTPQFEIQSSNPSLAQEIKSILESSYVKMAEALPDTDTASITVRVADSEAEFVSLVGGGFPDWGIACAIPSRDLIVLKSPLKFEYHRGFPQVVSHELAHIVLARLAGGKRIPRWLDEGFAMYQSHEWRIGDDVAVARAVLTGSILPLSRIESVNAFKESQAQLAYTESFLAVAYLYREFGQGTVEELAGHLATGVSLDAAFMKTIGSTYLAFQLEFEKYVQSKYNWTSLLADTLVIWIGLAFLFVLLYVLKMRRSHKTLEEWEREEERQQGDHEFPQDQTQI
jgi:hypothetical protein